MIENEQVFLAYGGRLEELVDYDGTMVEESSSIIWLSWRFKMSDCSAEEIGLTIQFFMF